MSKAQRNKDEYNLEWQKLLMPGDTLVLSVKELRNKTRQQLVEDNEGIKYAKRVLKETNDVNDFFKYFFYLTERVTHIRALSRFYNLPNKLAMDNAVRDINRKKDEAVKNFLTRSSNSVKESIAETGDKSAVEKWYKSILPYKEKMNEENCNYVEELYSSLME